MLGLSHQVIEEDKPQEYYWPAYALLEKLRNEEADERLRQRGPGLPQIFIGVRFLNNTYGIMERQYWDPEKAVFLKFLVGYVAAVEWATERIKHRPQFDDKQIDNLLKQIEKRQEEQYTLDSVLPDA